MKLGRDGGGEVHGEAGGLTQPAGADRVRDRSGGDAFPGWLAVLSALIVAIVAAVAVVTLEQYADNQRQAEIALVQIEGLSHRLIGLEWQAEAKQELSPSVARQVLDIRAELTRTLADFGRHYPDNDAARRVRAAFQQYEADVQELFRLYAAGRPDDARAWDEGRVDPGYERFLEATAAAEVVYGAEARRANLIAVLGSVLAMAFGSGLIAFLFWRFEREKQTHAFLVLAAEQRALRQSEERFRSLIRNASDVFFILESDSTVRYQSPAAERVLGFPGEALVGKSVFELIAPEDVDRAWNLFARAARNPGTNLATELRVRNTAGSWRDFELVSNNLLADPGVAGIVVTLRDVTERKLADREREWLLVRERLAHAEVEASRQEVEALLEATKQMAGSLDLGATLNSILDAIVRLAATDFAGVALLDAGRTTLRFEAVRGAQASLLGNASVRPGEGLTGIVAETGQPINVPNVEDEPRWLGGFPVAAGVGSGLWVPLTGREGVAGVLVAMSQQTNYFTPARERLLLGLADQAALAIEHARLFSEAGKIEALRELDQLKSEFMATVSHELRTPLSLVYGYADLLLSRELVSGEARSMVEAIYQGADRLTDLVDSVIDVGRIERGELTLELGEVDVRALVADLVGRFAVTTPSHHLEADLADGSLLVRGDARRLRQVVSHLLSNAVRYSPKGGVIRVRAVVEGEQTRISVSDQGIGLTTEQLERVFETFYRGKSNVMHERPGIGLGLAISRHVVEAHGGRIWVESAGLGCGVTFHLTLPLSSAQHAATEPLPSTRFPFEGRGE